MGKSLEKFRFRFYSWVSVFFIWDILFYLFFSDQSASVRIAFAKQNFSYFWNLVIPFLMGVALSAAFPWLSLFIDKLIVTPITLSRTLQEESRHEIEIVRIEYTIKSEEQKARLLEARELEAIEKAKRDQAARDVSDEATRAVLKVREETEREISDSAAEAAEFVINDNNISELERSIIRSLGSIDYEMKIEDLYMQTEVIDTVRKSAPVLTPSRVQVLVTDAVARLTSANLISEGFSGNLSLTRRGFDLFDLIMKKKP